MSVCGSKAANAISQEIDAPNESGILIPIPFDHS